MTKQGRPSGDWEAQRARVSDATWRVIAEHGLEGTSMRAIAAEMGVTTGVLSHYFRGKQQLLHFAMKSMFDALYASFRKAAEIKPAGDALRSLAMIALPNDGQSRLEWSVYLSYLSQAPRNPDYEQEIIQRTSTLKNIASRVIAQGQKEGTLSSNIDADKVIDEIQSTVEGLGVLSMVTPERFSRRRQSEMIDAIVKRIEN